MAGALLVGGAVREADADLRVAVHGEAGAVEAARAGAAPDVGDAEIALGDGDDGRVTGAAGIDDGAAAAAARARRAGGPGRRVRRRCGLRSRERGRLRLGLGGGRRLGLEVGDLVLEAARGALELRLQREHLVLALLALRDQLDGRRAVGLEGDATIGDLLAVHLGLAGRLGVALRHALHHVELREEVVEGPGREDDVDDARVVGLVDLPGTRREVIVGDVELVLRDLEQVLVAGDAVLDVLELAGRLVVTLDGHVGLLVDLAELRLHGGEPRLLRGDGAGRRGRGEREKHNERYETEEGRLADGGQTDRLLRAG